MVRIVHSDGISRRRQATIALRHGNFRIKHPKVPEESWKTTASIVDSQYPGCGLYPEVIGKLIYRTPGEFGA